MKYNVRISEVIREERVYEFEANNLREAAEMAHVAWIVNGQDTDCKELDVIERDYFVLGPSASKSFTCSELEL